MTTSHRLRLLIIEDSDYDVELLLFALRQSGFDPKYVQVDTAEDMRASLGSQPWDIVISDHAMSQFDSIQALRILQETGLDLPFIIVSGVIGEDTAVAAMRAGAQDYILKGDLARLGPAIERELREADVRRARREAEEEQRRLLQELEKRNLELEEQDKRLSRYLVEIQESRQRIMETQEAIRRRLAQELHGPAQNRLVVATIYLNHALERILEEPDEGVEYLARVRDLITEVNEVHLRSVITQLHPPLVRVSLVAAVHSLINGLHLAINANVIVEDSLEALDKQIPSVITTNAKVAICRVVEEALTNINKHSGALNVEVVLGTFQDAYLMVEIKDDGRGFDVDNTSPGMGLLTMKDYTGALGGYVNITSNTGSGTQVKAVVPLVPSGQPEEPSPGDRLFTPGLWETGESPDQ